MPLPSFYPLTPLDFPWSVEALPRTAADGRETPAYRILNAGRGLFARRTWTRRPTSGGPAPA